MSKSILNYFLLFLVITVFNACSKEGCTNEKATNYDEKAKKDDNSCIFDTIIPSKPQLKLVFKFDGTQQRLDNFGQPSTIPSGHGALTPTFNLMGVHFIELSNANIVPAGSGEFLYETFSTTAGGSKAAHFDSLLIGKDGDQFFTINLEDIAPATYKYIRISVAYQNYTIPFKANNLNLTGTIASFVGFNTYINKYTIKNQSVTVNGNKLQGYWGFETDLSGQPVLEGQSVGTTVPNPIASTSPIPSGSCLVTGVFENPLVISDNPTKDIIVQCSFSINKSFEWKDAANNNVYEPLDGDTVVDMGLRGLIPTIMP